LPRIDEALCARRARIGALTEPVWILLAAVLEFHGHSIAEFGGSPNPGPKRNRIGSRQAEKPARLRKSGSVRSAASYTSGLCQNHGFLDGKKRNAFVTGALFLGLNGYSIEAEQAEVIAAMLSLAEHLIGEGGYAQ